MLGVLDRQAEEVKFNGGFYTQRLEQLKDAPAEVKQLEEQLQELERKLQEAVRVGASLAAAVTESGKRQAEATELDRRLACHRGRSGRPAGRGVRSGTARAGAGGTEAARAAGARGRAPSASGRNG